MLSLLRPSRLAPIAASLCVVALLQMQLLGGPSEAEAQAFHDEVAEAVQRIPLRLEGWEGRDTDVPASARALLRPNALLGRQYQDLDTGRKASLVIVQCRDTRDMTGHYPPRCYPAHGWLQSETVTKHEIVVEGVSIPVTRYEFTRSEFDRVQRIAIDNFFVLPFGGLARDMEGVLEAASDYRVRPFGAAQVQVITDGTLPPEDRDAIFQDFVGASIDAIDAMRRESEKSDTP